MLIGVHIIVASGLGSLTENPAIAFALGIASHFIGDKIPHWEYSIAPLDELKRKSVGEKLRTCLKKDVFRVLSFIGLEIGGAFVLVFAIVHYVAPQAHFLPVLAGGFGGLLPDVLWGFADNSKNKILQAYRRLHHASHTKAENVSLRHGLIWQLAAVAIAIILLDR
ncbi:MAG: hypothetical protein Q7S09_01995 [bacterium]|nr:hypothetical protein [bacterium]